jgi:hypothetical protein
MVKNMEQQTKSILLRALSLMKDYKNSSISLQQLVEALEGSLKALDERLSEAFYREWYNHFVNLDVAVALGIEKMNKEDILNDVNQLEKIINDQLQTI